MLLIIRNNEHVLIFMDLCIGSIDALWRPKPIMDAWRSSELHGAQIGLLQGKVGLKELWARFFPICLSLTSFNFTVSPGFQRFINVMVSLTSEERKSFLQFTTGCSSLPPGGLANLHPRLTIVRKVDAGEGSYPSVNTCVHYLKLPEYPSEEILKERLMAATKEKGFHLN